MIFIGLVILRPAYGWAPTVTSVASGDWGATTTWDCDCVPETNENAVIATGHTVTLLVAHTINDLTISYGAILYHNNFLTLNGKLLLLGKTNLDVSMTEPEFMIYPNPSSGKDIHMLLSGFEQSAIVAVVFNTLGEAVHSEIIMQHDEVFIKAMDLSDKLTPGVYYVRAGMLNKKMLIQELVISHK